MENKYRFSEKNHVHELCIDGEWKKLTGVTSVLAVIAKPQLIQWAADMAAVIAGEAEKVEGLKKAYEKVQIIEDWKEKKKAKDELDKNFPIFKEARLAHRRKKEEAGQKGTDVHALIEERIKKAIEDNGFIKENGETNEQVKKFIQWAIDTKIKFLFSEKHLYSEKMWTGGICDAIAEIEGEIWLIDIKTGGIYPEAFWQMSAYGLMIKEMGIYPNIKGYIIIGLKNGLEEKRSISNEENEQAFLATLTIYRIKEKIENQVL